MNKILKYNEFVNEGLISDYISQKEQEEKEINTSSKRFVFEVLEALDKIETPFIFTCKDFGIYGKNIDTSSIHSKMIKYEDAKTMDLNNIHISEKNLLNIFEKDSKFIDKTANYKNIWKNIYKWFDNKYKKSGLTFNGEIKVRRILDWKDDIKKELL